MPYTTLAQSAVDWALSKISGTSSFSFWKSYFDDPEDSAAIAYGYMLKQGGV